MMKCQKAQHKHVLFLFFSKPRLLVYHVGLPTPGFTDDFSP